MSLNRHRLDLKKSRLIELLNLLEKKNPTESCIFYRVQDSHPAVFNQTTPRFFSARNRNTHLISINLMPPIGYTQLKPSPVHTGTPHLLLLTKASHRTFKVLHGHRDYAPESPELISLLPHRHRATFWYIRCFCAYKASPYHQSALQYPVLNHCTWKLQNNGIVESLGSKNTSRITEPSN